MVTTLHGASVTLRPATAADVPVLAGIRAKPEVYERWRGGEDLAASVADDLDDPDVQTFVIEHGDQLVGAIRWEAESDPDYPACEHRHLPRSGSARPRAGHRRGPDAG